MKNNEGLTLTQAARAMRLTKKTVRRHIKQGKIPFKLVPGKYGDEYRILELPPEKVRDEALDKTPTLALENLAGQLGATQERVRSLENQVKLLTTGQANVTIFSRNWWRRLFRRKE